jgi:hypothetical protein
MRRRFAAPPTSRSFSRSSQRLDVVSNFVGNGVGVSLGRMAKRDVARMGVRRRPFEIGRRHLGAGAPAAVGWRRSVMAEGKRRVRGSSRG